MKYLVLFATFVLFVAANETSHKLTCKLSPADIPKQWITMVDKCVQKLSDQVQNELNAAMTYMAMGAHFNRDSVNRPGFAEFFFHSASEEREHAMKILEYLLMRGELREDIRNLIKEPVSNKFVWPDAVTALREALKLEAQVTSMIREIIVMCESTPARNGIVTNDFHLVDYLTGEFLEEQYRGQRAIAGHIATLGKLMDFHGPIGEFLYDKKLLEA